MKNPKAPGPLVLLKWIDSAGPDGWVERGGWDAEVIKCETVGWLVGKTKLAYIVASTVADLTGQSERHHSPLAIPRAAVQSFEKL